jgi:SH3-like domain-containing protein
VRGEASAEVPLRRRAEDSSVPVARLKPGVIGRIRGCDAGSDWCEVQVQDRRGFIRRAEIFGVLPDEEIK